MGKVQQQQERLRLAIEAARALKTPAEISTLFDMLADTLDNYPEHLPVSQMRRLAIIASIRMAASEVFGIEKPAKTAFHD